MLQHRLMGQSHALLQACRAGGVLKERERVGSQTRLGQFDLEIDVGSCPPQKRSVVRESNVLQQIVRKLVVDDDGSRLQVRRDAGQPEAIFAGLDFEVGIGEDRRNCTQQHGSRENGHQRDTLRHDQDNAIAAADAALPEHGCL